MIKINDKQYDNFDIKVTWNKFKVSNNHGATLGYFIHSNENDNKEEKAPFVVFCVEDRILIGLEFSCSQEMFLNTKVNVKTNVKQYLSDITYEDKKGWDSLIVGKYDCNITRIDDKTFNLDFYVEDFETKITINTNINLL